LLAIVFASVALIGTWGSVQWLPLWANQMVSEQGVQALKAEHPGWYAAPDGSLLPEAAKAKKAAETNVKQHAGKASANIQMIQGFGAIVGTLLAPLIGARFGRRPAYFLLCLSSLVVCAITFRTIQHYSDLFLAWTFVMSLTTASFYGWFPLYLPELFPTRVRATGQGLSFNFGRIFAAVGALTQGHLVATFGGSYAKAGAIVTLIYLLGMVLIWFAPETKGKPLPE
jgi:MFS family permease